MPYNSAADSFHTKELCSRFSAKVVDFYMRIGHFAFLTPHWGLEAAYNVHLRLIGKCIVDFLLVIITFFTRFYGWHATSEYRLEIAVFEGNGSRWYKISGRSGHPPPTICTWLDRPVIHLTTLLLKVFTQRNFAADFLREKYTFRGKNSHFAFLSPLWGA